MLKTIFCCPIFGTSKCRKCGFFHLKKCQLLTTFCRVYFTLLNASNLAKFRICVSFHPHKPSEIPSSNSQFHSNLFILPLLPYRRDVYDTLRIAIPSFQYQRDPRYWREKYDIPTQEHSQNLIDSNFTLYKNA